ncbi:MAG TPA: hypothetical protein VKR41_13065 [Puia sp.]|nr:hypothetical protein [Puia sp.]
MKKWPWLIALPFFQCCLAPGPRYTLTNAHSHNDYEQPTPFWTAYNAQFGSIDSNRRLQMLIDVKADSTAVLDSLIALLGKYPNLTQTPSLTWVISGNRPDPSMYASYPQYIAFDGILLHEYSSAALSRIVMMSDDLQTYTHWEGTGGISAADRRRILAAIAWAHALHQPVRFWDAPDFPHAWQQLMQLRVDFINTDHIEELAEYLSAH